MGIVDLDIVEACSNNVSQWWLLSYKINLQSNRP